MPIAPIAANPAERTAPATSEPMTAKPVAHDQEWLIAPHESAPSDPADRAAVVAGDANALRERAALDQYLAGAFVDPQAARDRLDALVERDGQTSAARRIVADPAQLGELRGRTGLLAGSAAREERARAEKVAGAIAPALVRITDAEAAAGSRYDQRVAAERAAEAVGVLRLSDAAAQALAGVAEAPDAATRAERWRAVASNTPVAAEIERFTKAVEQRFGSEAVRAMDRGERVTTSRIAPAERERVAEVARIVSTVRPAERAAVAESQKLAALQRTTQGRHLKP